MGQVIANVILYGFLGWLLYDAIIREYDPWFAFVVAFTVGVAILVQLMPGLHAKGLSPGEYPYSEE